MNGYLFQLLILMLMQNPGGEVMPTPNRNGSGIGIPTGMPGTFPVLPPEPISETCAIGWGTDIHDGKFCMIIQIAPEAIASFARGPQGQELPAPVPDAIRNRIEKVIVRIGSGPVERNPPNPQTLSESRPAGTPPYLNDLVNRTTVPIDTPRSTTVMPASGGSGLTVGNGPVNTGAYGSVNNTPDAYPNPTGNLGNTNNYSDRSRLINSQATNGMNNGVGSPGQDNGYNSSLGTQPTNTRNDVLPFNATTSSSRDGFSPPQTKSQSLDFLQQNRTNPNASGYASGGYSPNQGINTIPGGYTNQGNLTGGTSRPYTPLASNSNPNSSAPGFHDYSNTQPSNYPSVSPSLAQSQLFGAPSTQQQSPYAGANPQMTGTNASFAGFPTQLPRPPVQGNESVVDDPNVGKDKLLPFLLLFSIVGNVYLGLWMNQLRCRYRLLLSNMRGIPVPDFVP